MRNIIIIFLIFLLITLTFVAPTKAAALPAINSRSAAIFDLATGEVLAGIEENTQVYPASTTKVLTALLVVELVDDLSTMVTVSHRAEQQVGTSLYACAGEEYTVHDLLYALMVLSANDVAVALAEHVAGSVEQFSQLMNARAKQLGATDSNFVNPNGLPDEEHYTTAADMAKIFAAAFRYPQIREMMATRVYYIDLPSGERRPLVSGNKMLTQYEGILGGKTGYTSQAGNCIVAAARVDNLQLGVAVFKAQGSQLWEDATALLDYGFSMWSNIKFIGREQAITAVPVRYTQEKLLLVADVDVQTIREKTDDPLLTTWELTLDRPLQAPLAAGEPVGEVTYFLDGQVIGVTKARVAYAVSRDWYTYWEAVLLVGFIGTAWRFVRVRNRQLPQG